MNHFLILILFILSSCASKVLLQEDFDQKPSVVIDQGEKRIQILEDQDRKESVLEVRYPKGGFNTTSGASWKVKLPKEQEKAAASYWIRFAKSFDFVKGGKLPGLIGGHRLDLPSKSISGGHPPVGDDGWSARIMWRRGGEIVQYVYHLDQPEQYGEDFPWKFKNGDLAKFKPGEWHHVRTEITMNDPGEKNGRIRSWLDGKEVLDQQNLRLRKDQVPLIDTFYFSTFFGGNDPSWSPPKDETIRFDNIIVEVQ